MDMGALRTGGQDSKGKSEVLLGEEKPAAEELQGLCRGRGEGGAPRIADIQSIMDWKTYPGAREMAQ